MDFISYALAKKALDATAEGLKISNIEIKDGELIITPSVGNPINAGKIPTADLEALKVLENQLKELEENVIIFEDGKITKPLILQEDPTEDFQAATKKYVDEKHIEYIVSKKKKENFPQRGLPNVLYKAEEEKKLYQWNPNSLTYEVLGGSSTGGIENIEIINGGNSNARN